MAARGFEAQVCKNCNCSACPGCNVNQWHRMRCEQVAQSAMPRSLGHRTRWPAASAAPCSSAGRRGTPARCARRPGCRQRHHCPGRGLSAQCARGDASGLNSSAGTCQCQSVRHRCPAVHPCKQQQPSAPRQQAAPAAAPAPRSAGPAPAAPSSGCAAPCACRPARQWCCVWGSHGGQLAQGGIMHSPAALWGCSTGKNRWSPGKAPQQGQGPAIRQRQTHGRCTSWGSRAMQQSNPPSACNRRNGAAVPPYQQGAPRLSRAPPASPSAPVHAQQARRLIQRMVRLSQGMHPHSEGWVWPSVLGSCSWHPQAAAFHTKC